jgi:signal peptidase I
MDLDNNKQSIPQEQGQDGSSAPSPASPSSLSPKERAIKAAKDIFEIIEMFTVCASVIMILFSFFVHPTVVEGESMENTLLGGDYLLVSDIAYTPQAGDIVVVHNVGLRHYNKPIVKRVIATAGQTVDIDFSTWTLTVDGVVIDEPYIKLTTDQQLTSDWTYPMQIPEGYIFVMGDNRNHSADSRCRDIGLIDERCVVGKAFVRVFPLNRFTVFD